MKIIAIVAISIDGKIAINSHHSSDWTSPEDKIFLHNLLDNSNVVIVGNNTYKNAIKPLSKRKCIVFTNSVDTILKKSDNLVYCNPQNIKLSDLIRDYEIVALLGGTQTYTYFLKNNLIDELFITIEPLIFGKGLSIFDCADEKPNRFQLLSVKKLNNSGSLLLHYKNENHSANFKKL